MNILFKKLKQHFKPPVSIPPDEKRELIDLTQTKNNISVETALNSRCTSDHNEDPLIYHWGMFDRRKRLGHKTIDLIVQTAQKCSFTGLGTHIRIKKNMAIFIVNNKLSGIQKEHAMVESGMQQQAVSLVCAAIGAGMVFKSLGNDGTMISEKDLGTTRILMDAMKPSYNGSYWTKEKPLGKKSWLPGNLPEPVREGNVPLFSVLESIKPHHNGSQSLSDKMVGQLLWAARGRTPHFYKSKPWGMTIPTSKGEQHLTSIYLMDDNGVYQYLNQKKSRPTHSVKLLSHLQKDAKKRLSTLLPKNKRMILLAKNEDSVRASWEIGYQLLNIIIQARSLNLTYSTLLLNHEKDDIADIIKIKFPLAIVSL